MKKLNRKGFTLIELLAIIVILAIIMVVTIPTVLGSLGESRQTMFNTSADTVADTIEKQYTLYLANPSDTTIDSSLKTDCFSKGTGCSSVSIMNSLKALGVKPANYSSATVSILASGRACVTLVASETAGDFKDVANKTATSTGC